MANEKRLIDANELLDRAIKEKRFVFSMKDLITQEIVVKTVYKDLADFIFSAPTVDAVEVVRCKDCKHWKNEINGCTEDKRFCDIGFYMVHKDGFCSYGERKDYGNG